MRTAGYRRKRWWALILCGGSLILACDPKRHSVVTRIEQDGSIRRTMTRPLDESLPPEAALAVVDEARVEDGPQYQINNAWKRHWESLEYVPPPPNSAGGKYIRAVGTFSGTDDLPPDYHIAVPLVDRPSLNRIRHDYTDYVLFGIDEWQETITDTVRLDEYVEALDAMLDDLIPPFQQTLQEITGEEYDITELNAFIEKDARRALRRTVLLLYQFAAARTTLEQGEFFQTLKDVLADIGYELPLAVDGTVDDENFEARTQAYLLSLLESKVVLRDTREKLSRDQTRELFERIERSFQEPDTAEENQPAQDQPQQERKSPFEETFFRKLTELHGESYIDRRHARLTAMMQGAYGSGTVPGLASFVVISIGGRDYRYELESAGPILETNGRKVSFRKVVWEFSEGELFPHGHAMRARSIRINREAERKIFGKVVLDEVGRIYPLLEALPCSSAAIKALRAALAEESLKPIRDLNRSEEQADRDAADALLELAQ